VIPQLEDAVIQRIKDAQTAALWSYKLGTIESYAGQIDEEKQSTFKFPAVFASFVGWKPKAKTGERGRIITVDLMLYVAAHNPRNERATRHGDMHEPGTYQIAEDVIALLENQRLGMMMHQPLMSNGIQTIFVGRKSDGAKAESVLALPFECEFVWQAALPECANVTTDDWLTTGQTFYLPEDGTADLAAVTQHAAP
jgi:phage gp37-like protein